MNLMWKIACLVIVACPAADAADPVTDLTGEWITEATEYVPVQQHIVFQRQGETWTGTMSSQFGIIELKDIKFDGVHLTFNQVFDLKLGPVGPIQVHGLLCADKLHLKMNSPTGGFKDRVARKAGAGEAAAIEAVIPNTTSLAPLPDNGLARRPPLGWNSFNHFGVEIDDTTVREIADAMVTSGLRDAGYVFVNIDDGWQGERDHTGKLQPNAKFPDMKALGDYIHSRGLKFGIYSGPGTRTCGGFPASFGHEEQDARTYAEWGVDYLKYDWCSADYLYSTPAEMHAAYHKMGHALQNSGRPIVYAICQYGLFDVGKWGRNVGANAWRSTFDILDNWERMAELGFGQVGKDCGVGPGGWNDPDMLEVGNGGLNLTECRTHMTLWSMLSAPLLLGNDIRNMTTEIKAILTNKEVLAVDQDSLGNLAHRVLQREETEIWRKQLSDGSTAVALFNRGDTAAEVEARWSDLGLTNVSAVRDLWQQIDVPPYRDGYRATLPSHGAVLLRVKSDKRPVSTKTPLSVIFIGDSITEAVGDSYTARDKSHAPPVYAAKYLSTRPTIGTVNCSNHGHAGYTTVDFLPSRGSKFKEVEQAATNLMVSNGGQLVFSLMLGTNDSAMDGPAGAPIIPADYRKNLIAIVDQLASDFPASKIILHCPIWYSPNTHNGARYLSEGLDRLEKYFPELEAVVNTCNELHPRQVFLGDTEAYQFFKDHHKTYLIAEPGQQGVFYLHPNQKGAALLGQYWASAIAESLD